MDDGPDREISVVRSFLAALEEPDLDRAFALVDPDIEYENVSLRPLRGRAEFETALRRFFRLGTGFEATVHHIAANGAHVLTERTDVVTLGPLRFEFWVCGTFEVRDGLIVVWRDYFDWLNLVTAALRAVPRAVLGRLSPPGAGLVGRATEPACVRSA